MHTHTLMKMNLFLKKKSFHLDWLSYQPPPPTSHHQFKRNKTKKINTTEKTHAKKAISKLLLSLCYAKLLSSETSHQCNASGEGSSFLKPVASANRTE